MESSRGMDLATDQKAPEQTGGESRLRVLNVGCGIKASTKLHSLFKNSSWDEIRFDIDASVKPDIVGSMTELSKHVPDESFDAIWSSHNIEHLYAHEVLPCLAGFKRALKPTGFALITCPDLKAIAKLLVDDRGDVPAYVSPAGPITALDMIYGHSASLERGNLFMAHKTGFTRTKLAKLLTDSGFSEVWTATGKSYDLWALAVLPKTDSKSLRASLGFV